jgi:hypothetical protein
VVRRNMLGKVWAILVLGLIGGIPAFATTAFGTFSTDDQVQLFTVTLNSPGALTVQTFGYAGNASPFFAPGGFDPELTLFKGTGVFLANNDDGGCGTVAQDPTTLNCFDAIITTAVLPAGNYFLALTESNNDPNGPTLADGFTQTGQGNFTCAEFFPPHTGPFCDPSPAVRNGNWALQVTGANNVQAGVVPEPGSCILVALGLGLLVQKRRRRMYR